MAGRAALTAVQIGSQVDLLKYSLDAEDNLLARKHVTQVRILKCASDMLIIIIAIGLAARALLSNVTARVQIAIDDAILSITPNNLRVRW